jgi:hypothetical protein
VGGRREQVSYVVAAIATLLIAIGALGMVAPGQLVAIVSAWPPQTLLVVGVGGRLAIGVIFLLGASTCRFPAVVAGIGILALAGALLLLLLGEPRLDALVRWWSQLPTVAIRAWSALAALVGVLVLYAALPPPRSAIQT